MPVKHKNLTALLNDALIVVFTLDRLTRRLPALVVNGLLSDLESTAISSRYAGEILVGLFAVSVLFRDVSRVPSWKQSPPTHTLWNHRHAGNLPLVYDSQSDFVLTSQCNGGAEYHTLACRCSRSACKEDNDCGKCCDLHRGMLLMLLLFFV